MRHSLFDRVARAFATLLLAAPLASQQPTGGTVRGVAYDSLRGRVMANAFIELLPTGRQVATTGEGSFLIGNVPAGDRYRLRIMHAVLDTLGLSLTTPDFRVGAGDTALVDVGVPGAGALTKLLCPPLWIERGAGVVAGFVRDPETGSPVDSAALTLVYDESPVRQIKLPVSRISRPDSSGYFTVCGLPAVMNGKVQVERNGVKSGEIPVVTTGDSPIALRGLTLSPSLTRVIGRVTDRSGTPIGEAEVLLDATRASTRTDVEGNFSLDGVPLGSQSISIRKIGYAVTEHAIEVARYPAAPVAIVMPDFVPTMTPVVTVSQRIKDMEETGYARRKERGFGYYADGDQLDRNSVSLGEALRTVPGIRVGYDASNQRGQKALIMTARDPRGCLRYVVDGVFWSETGGDIEKLIRPQDLEAIEMYSPIAVPGEFAAAGRGRCSVLVIWTRHKIRRATR